MGSLRVGDGFPDLTLESIDGPVRLSERWAESPLVVVFMRHFGCAFCREHLILLGQRYDDIRAVGGDVIAIFQYSAESTQSFCDSRGVPFDCLGDPARAGYRAAGLGRGPRSEYLGWNVYKNRGARSEGRCPRRHPAWRRRTAAGHVRGRHGRQDRLRPLQQGLDRQPVGRRGARRRGCGGAG